MTRGGTGTDRAPEALQPPGPDDPDTVAAYFAALTGELLVDHDERAILERICAQATTLVPAAELCGITVRRRRGRLETLAATGPLAQRCDELQYELGEGPCVDAAREGEAFVITETATDERWPRWGPRVAAEGVNSLLSVDLSPPPWFVGDDPLGAVNLYARTPRAFGPVDLTRMQVFAAHAGTALATARKVGSLEEAVEARHRIGVAQGVLMQRDGIGLDQAFELLQRYSSTANLKLRDVAAEVARTGALPDTPTVEG